MQVHSQAIPHSRPTAWEAFGKRWGSCGHQHPSEYAANLCARDSRKGPARMVPDAVDGVPILQHEDTGSDRVARPVRYLDMHGQKVQDTETVRELTVWRKGRRYWRSNGEPVTYTT